MSRQPAGVLGNRRAESPGPGKHAGPPDRNIPLVGRQRGRRIIEAKRLISFPVTGERIAQREVSPGVGWLEGDVPAIQPDRASRITGELRQTEGRVGIRGIGGERGRIGPRGTGRVARVVERIGEAAAGNRLGAQDRRREDQAAQHQRRNHGEAPAGYQESENLHGTQHASQNAQGEQQ